MVSQLVISLDFELHWGVFDHVDLDTAAKRYFQRTRQLIPVMLERFSSHGVRATWATVGLLFARDRRQMLDYMPERRPAYGKRDLNAYRLLEEGKVGDDEADDPLHFAPSLIRRILDTPGQELASHTFSHYYCLEDGQNASTFAADLEAAAAIARDNFDVTLRSLVLPRNQDRPDYQAVMAKAGFAAYRSNPPIWFWRSEASGAAALPKKACRFADHYLPLDGKTAFGPVTAGKPCAVPASRFFRPYVRSIDRFAQALKIGRIKREMTKAAKDGQSYHLWWHPHNMATDPTANLAALDDILGHFKTLSERHGMESATMADVAYGSTANPRRATA